MKKSEILKASIWNIIGTFLLKGITFLSVPIFTRLMSQSDYGYVSTYTTYISFAGIIIGLGLNTAIYNARIDFKNRFSEFNSSIIKASGAVFVCEVIIANGCSDAILNALGLSRLYLNLILLISFAEYIVNSYYKINTIDFKFKKNVILSIFNSIFNLSFSIIFILILKDDVLGKLIGQSSFLFLVACILFVLIGFRRANTFEFNDIKYALKVGIPNIFHQISQLIMAQSDKVMILYFIDSSATAKYSVVYTYALVMQMLWNAINEVWVPWLYRKLKSEDNNAILKYSKYYVGAFSLLAASCMLVMPDFMFILAPSNYNDSKELISIVILATYFLFLYSFFVNLELYYKKNQYTAIATIMAGFVNIVGNSIFIPKLGYVAAAYTTLGAYAFLMIVHYFVTTYILNINIYPIKFFMPFITATCVVSVFSSCFLEMYIYRWIVFAVIVVVISLLFAKNNKKIVLAIKEIKKR